MGVLADPKGDEANVFEDENARPKWLLADAVLGNAVREETAAKLGRSAARRKAARNLSDSGRNAIPTIEPPTGRIGPA